MKISAIIVKAKEVNEELYKKARSSVSWCDEVIVIPGIRGTFSQWRNEGAKKAKGDWLLYIDTDEEVTPALEKVILQVVGSDEFAAYAIPRKNFIFGKEMKYCGLWPDYVLRLIKKDKLVSWEGDLHEQPKIKGEICHLKEPLIHHKNATLTEMVEKTNDWSEVEARLMFEAHHPPMNVFRFASAALREFWKRMVLETAFLDGTEGVIYGLYQVFSRLISYSKLWELQIKNAGGNL